MNKKNSSTRDDSSIFHYGSIEGILSIETIPTFISSFYFQVNCIFSVEIVDLSEICVCCSVSDILILHTVATSHLQFLFSQRSMFQILWKIIFIFTRKQTTNFFHFYSNIKSYNESPVTNSRMFSNKPIKFTWLSSRKNLNNYLFCFHFALFQI